MNIEIFGYSVLASILGISIVFFSLCGLSLLMVGLKIIFGESSNKNVKETIPDDISTSNTQDQKWIIAAVSAFIAVEEAEMRVPSANVWLPGIAEHSDSWMNRWASGNILK